MNGIRFIKQSQLKNLPKNHRWLHKAQTSVPTHFHVSYFVNYWVETEKKQLKYEHTNCECSTQYLAPPPKCVWQFTSICFLPSPPSSWRFSSFMTSGIQTILRSVCCTVSGCRLKLVSACIRIPHHRSQTTP